MEGRGRERGTDRQRSGEREREREETLKNTDWEGFLQL